MCLNLPTLLLCEPLLILLIANIILGTASVVTTIQWLVLVRIEVFVLILTHVFIITIIVWAILLLFLNLFSSIIVILAIIYTSVYVLVIWLSLKHILLLLLNRWGIWIHLILIPLLHLFHLFLNSHFLSFVFLHLFLSLKFFEFSFFLNLNHQFIFVGILLRRMISVWRVIRFVRDCSMGDLCATTWELPILSPITTAEAVV